ncbi:MAG: hypothetical protein HY903_08455 [Deltaproteobacteria bacterium]|nr:hypothetical protein [Deltaproteobacteria bacterium]
MSLADALFPDALFLALSLLFVGCAARQSQVRPVPPFAAVVGPVVIAHRGGSLEAPENTVASLSHAVVAGADWQECDVTLTKDEHVVVIHDDTLERTTNGQGKVAAKTLAELRALDASRPKPAELTRTRLAERGIEPPDFGARFAGAKIPTFDEVLSIPGRRLMIELKRSDRGPLLVRKVAEGLRQADFTAVMVASFDDQLLFELHNVEPALPLLGLAADDASIERMLMLPISVLGVRADLAAAALKTAPAGVAVWAWTIYDAKTAVELAELGVHGIITDAPTSVLAALRQDPADAP